MHQSVSLQAGGESCAAASSRSTALGIRTRTLDAAVPTRAGAEYAAQCELLEQWLQLAQLKHQQHIGGQPEFRELQSQFAV